MGCYGIGGGVGWSRGEIRFFFLFSSLVVDVFDGLPLIERKQLGRADILDAPSGKTRLELLNRAN